MANPKSCSPTNFLGQSWSNWADAAFSGESNDTESTAVEAVDSGEDSSKRGNGKAESMKLHRTDFALFGICPTQDPFYLVVCEQCGQVVKPQGLKHHIDTRHHGKAPDRPPEKMKVFRAVHPQPVPQSKHPPHRDSPRSCTLSASQRPPPQPPPAAPPRSSIPSPSKEVELSPIVVPVLLSVPLPPQPDTETIASPVCRPTRKEHASQPETTSNDRDQPAVIIPKMSPEQAWTQAPILKELPPAAIVATKKTKKKEVPTEFLPLKDREYDPNKHCGVIAADNDKPCLRSLTCKTHALSLRRKVPGRHKPLDELLAERKALNASNHSKSTQGFHPVTPQLASSIPNLNVIQNSDRLHTVPKTPPKTPPTPRPPRPPDTVHQAKRSHAHSAPSTPTTGDPHHPALRRSDSVGKVIDISYQPDGREETVSTSDLPNCTYQPKPIAVCHYGAHHVGRGVYLFDRRLHSLRSSIKALIDKQLTPPPAKKVCSSASLAVRPTSQPTILPSNNIPSVTSHTKVAAHAGSVVLNKLPSTLLPSKTLTKSSHSKRSKATAKSIRAVSGSTLTKAAKTHKKNANVSTSTSATSSNNNANQLIANSMIPFSGTLQLASGSGTPFLVTTNGLQNAEFIDANLIGVDSSMNSIEQSANLNNLRLVVTNIDPNVNGAQQNQVNQARIPIFNAIAGNTPVLLQNITVGHAGKVNVKSRTKNNSKLKGGKAKTNVAFQAGILVNSSLLQQQQQQLVSQVKSDSTTQEIVGIQTSSHLITKSASNMHLNQGSASPRILSSLPNGTIPSPSSIKAFPPSGVLNAMQQDAILQQSPCNTSSSGPYRTDTSSTTNITAVLSQTGKVGLQLLATCKANASLGKPITNQQPIQLAHTQQFQSQQQLMANLITSQQGKPIQINNAVLQNHAGLSSVVQGKSASALAMAFNQQPIFLQGQNLSDHHQQQ